MEGLGEASRLKQNLLSQAGKKVLIKTVAQTIPTYPMNIFQFPLTTCNALMLLLLALSARKKMRNGRSTG